MERAAKFDLEEAIGEWRNRFSGKGICSPDELDELEVHLRDQVAALANSELSEQEAYAVGVLRLGNREQIGVEFAKAHPFRCWWRRVRILLFAAPSILFGFFAAVYLVPKAQNDWEKSGVSESLDWVMNIPIIIFESFIYYGPYVLVALVAIFIMSDKRMGRFSWSGCSLSRFFPIAVISYTVNLAVLVALTFLCIASLLVP